MLDKNPDSDIHKFGGFDPVLFSKDLDKYLRESHRMAVRGYLAAGVAALASLVFSLIEASYN